MDHVNFAQLLGNYGEFVGAIAVVFTLGYLAVQIRQNTSMVRMSAMQSIIQGSVDHNRAIADNGELAKLLIRAAENFDDLTSEDRLRLNTHAVTLYQHLDAAFLMYEAGHLDQKVWEKFAYEAPIWINGLPFAAQWYESDKFRLSSGFREFLDERIQETKVPAVMPAFGSPMPEPRK